MYMLWNDLKVVFIINETLLKLDQTEYDVFHIHLKSKRFILSENQELGHLI